MNKSIKNFFGKKNIYFASKGSDAMEQVLKNIKIKNAFFQSEGGWHTYPESAKNLGFEIKFLAQKEGKLIQMPTKNSALIINSMPGYLYLEDIEKINNYATKNNVLLINDVTGSIGTIKPLGDIIICSLGKHKPLSIGKGALIATNKELKINQTNLDKQKIAQEIENIPKKLLKWKNLNKKIRTDLKDFILNKEVAINILVNLKKETLINYCKENKLEYLECPNYNRTNKKGHSIEVKRR